MVRVTQAEFLANGYTIDNLGSPSCSPVSGTSVGDVAALGDVSNAVGGLLLTDNQATISSSPTPPTSFTVDGADIGQPRLGPLSEAAVSSGRPFAASDTDKNVVLVGPVNPTSSHTVSVPLSASVSGAAIGAAVALALAGGLLAGAFGSWRIGRLHPADAIAKAG